MSQTVIGILGSCEKSLKTSNGEYTSSFSWLVLVSWSVPSLDSESFGPEAMDSESLESSEGMLSRDEISDGCTKSDVGSPGTGPAAADPSRPRPASKGTRSKGRTR